MPQSRSLRIDRKFAWTQVRDLFRFAARRLEEEGLPQIAGSLTFTTVLALVPVLTIAFAVFTAFPVFKTFQASLEGYFIQNLMPKTIANTILGYLNQFAAKSKGVSAIGGVILVFTAVTMMSMIDRVFNRIWRVKNARPMRQRILVYWAIITLGPLLIGGSISVTSYVFSATGGAVASLPVIGAIFYTVVSVSPTSGAFALLYMAVPNRLIDWRDALWGGLLAGVAFEIAKRLFTAYIIKFPTYTMVYGAVAAVPIFLVWIYLFWMITLSGALVTAALPVVKYERWWHVATPGSAFIDAMWVLKVLYDARTAGANAAVDAATIRSATRLGFDESENLLQKMLAAGWVGRIKIEMPKRAQWGKFIPHGYDRWTLLVNPSELKLADVYRLFVFTAASELGVAKRVEQAIEQGLHQSLAEHFASDEYWVKR